LFYFFYFFFSFFSLLPSPSTQHPSKAAEPSPTKSPSHAFFASPGPRRLDHKPPRPTSRKLPNSVEPPFSIQWILSNLAARKRVCRSAAHKRNAELIPLHSPKKKKPSRLRLVPKKGFKSGSALFCPKKQDAYFVEERE
jgi:hypothetical protein